MFICMLLYALKSGVLTASQTDKVIYRKKLEKKYFVPLFSECLLIPATRDLQDIFCHFIASQAEKGFRCVFYLYRL